MKIRHKLRLIVALPLVLAVLLGVVLAVSWRKVSRAVKAEEVATEVVTGVFELNLLTYEYLQHHEMRPRMQWQARYESLGDLLQGIQPDGLVARDVVETALAYHLQIGGVFKELAERHDQGLSVDAVGGEYDLRLVGQLLAKSQSLVARVAWLVHCSEDDREAEMRRAACVIFGLVGLTAALTAAVALWVTRSVTRPLRLLRSGTEQIGRGALDHRVPYAEKDELGELAAAFNQMAGRLRHVTVRRDELSAEVARRTQVEDELLQQSEALARSNEELAMFAHVASHDLQEPLRTVGSFAQLLAQRYGDTLDADGEQMLHFITDGAKRSQALIQDLLTYARVSTRGREFEPVDLECLYDEAVQDLSLAIAETEAQVTRGSLPAVTGDRVQLGQVLRNLIGNALKFHAESRPPVIHVGAERENGSWVITVRDNGIGIESAQAERVFTVFQRLNGSAYAGTGIGLAICKKIVERHGGRIWIEPAPGGGVACSLSLPAADG